MALVTVGPTEVAESAGWAGPGPAVTVVVSTYSRSGFLADLFAALEAQEPPSAGFEVVVVDNGSTDDTWGVLNAYVARTPLRLYALRLETNAGPASARNTAAAHGRGRIIACTDDDCVPEGGWLAALVRPFADAEVDLVQGRTRPEENNPIEHAPWSRSIVVEKPTVLFETCNIAYRRQAFEQAGGFPVGDPLTDRAGGGRAFGEDVVLGARIAATSERAFAAEAVVRHRWLPCSYRDYLRGRGQLVGFRLLARDLPVVAAGMAGRRFLTRRTRTTDLGIAGLGVAVLTRRPVAALAALPWAAACWREGRWKPGRPHAVRAAQIAVADAVGLAALAVGSARARRILL